MVEEEWVVKEEEEEGGGGGIVLSPNPTQSLVTNNVNFLGH